MKPKRVIKGNNYVLPLGAEILGQYATNAVTDRSARKKGNQPISNLESVIEARNWEMDKEM